MLSYLAPYCKPTDLHACTYAGLRATIQSEMQCNPLADDSPTLIAKLRIQHKLVSPRIDLQLASAGKPMTCCMLSE